MKVLILSRRRGLYATRRLVEAASQAGHEPVVADPMDCWLVCGSPGLAIHGGDGGTSLAQVHVAIPRIGSSVTDYGLAVVAQLEAMGVPVVNTARAIGRARDKLRCLQLLAGGGVPVPRTVMARGTGRLGHLLDLVGGPPVVLKLLRGTQGIGVMLAETAESVESVLHTLGSLGQSLLVQEFVAESRGRDVRALVLGDRVLTAVRRTARDGEFRSNIHRGATAEFVELPETYERVAVQAARILGLHLAGVDMLESLAGPVVIEVNACPGFEGIEKATGVDVAREILRHAEAFARAQAAGGGLGAS